MNFEKRDTANTQGTKTEGGLRCCHPHDVSAVGEETLGLQISILEHAQTLRNLSDAEHALEVPTTQEGTAEGVEPRSSNAAWRRQQGPSQKQGK